MREEDGQKAAVKSLISSFDEARSGLKMGVRSPADVVALWFREAVVKSGAGSCACGPFRVSFEDEN
jgi:hypothetical protein